jgi:hypothetical protein
VPVRRDGRLPRPAERRPQLRPVRQHLRPGPALPSRKLRGHHRPRGGDPLRRAVRGWRDVRRELHREQRWPSRCRCPPVCTDVSSDDRNCGDCGDACQSGFECRQAQCQAVICPQGRIWCGGACVDPQTDPRNCGGCTAPPQGAPGCPGEGCCAEYGLTSCGATGSEYFACTSLSGDPYNCGSCKNVCPGNESCRQGQCAPLVCPTGQVACDKQCVPGSTCGERCEGDGQTCSAGTCQ